MSAQLTPRTTPRLATRARIRRGAAALTTLAAALVAAGATAGAQTAAPGGRAAAPLAAGAFELRPVVGAFVPTGDQRDLLDDAVLVGGQLAYAVRPNLAVVGTFGWAPSKDRTTALAGGGAGLLRTGRAEAVDLFQYDVGVEARLPRAFAGGTWTAVPFAGLGGGGRTFRYRDVDGADAQTNVAGYGALGVELAPAAGRLGVRLEARDYVSAFRGLRGERSERTARNDLALSGGVTVRF
jgi:hypothetical protein